jgi:L-threonylcarbamoyladenylate synthase
VRTRLLDASRPPDLDEAARLLRAGGLVAFPTETVYGLGALALDPVAVRGIYAAKGRPATNPLIVHAQGVDEARVLATSWPVEAGLLAARFWPGPLTLVLPRSKAVPDEVTAGGATVALRVPSHPVARALLERVGAPLAAPSANRAEHVSPTVAAHVRADLDGRIDAILDGGACEVGIESTVLSLDPGGRRPPRLLRAGAIGRAQLQEALQMKIEDGPAAPPDGAIAASPGLHARHYAPAGVVRLVPAASLERTLRALAQAGHLAGALARSAAEVPGAHAWVRLPSDARGYARGFYAGLRELEERGCSAIAIETTPDDGEWEAVADRLKRASS